MVNSNPIRRQSTEVDPMFNIPDGVDEIVYSEDDVSISIENEDNEYYYDYSEEEVSDEEVFFEEPPVPTILSIVSQSINTTATGNQTVDVVLDIEDFAGYDIEFKVAKV